MSRWRQISRSAAFCPIAPGRKRLYRASSTGSRRRRPAGRMVARADVTDGGRTFNQQPAMGAAWMQSSFAAVSPPPPRAAGYLFAAICARRELQTIFATI